MKTVIATSCNPIDFRSGMGLIVGNTLKSLSIIDMCDISLIVFCENDLSASFSNIKNLINPKKFIDLHIQKRVWAKSMLYRSVTCMPLLHEECKFLKLLLKYSNNADNILWFGSSWDTLSSKIAGSIGCPVVFHATDSISMFEQNRSTSKINILRSAIARKREKKVLLSGYKAAIYVARSDTAFASTICPEIPIITLPNGVDTTYFYPYDQYKQKKQKPIILFSGVMEYIPNIAAAKKLVKEVLPLIKNDVKVRIAGRNPVKSVKDLASKNVDIVDEVTDMAEEYRSADLFAAPMFSGTGFKNKIAEALSCGLPVVCTHHAAKGFNELPPGIFTVNTIKEMAAIIDELLDDTNKIEKEGMKAASYMVENCSWEKRTRKLIDFLQNIV